MDKVYDQYERVFHHFDANEDGKISPVEIQQCVASMGGGMTAEEAEAAVALMDSDGDGLLCLEDFVRAVEGAAEEEKVEDLKAAFSMYEEGGGIGKSGGSAGCITPKSLRKMLSKLGEKRSMEECRGMIASFDLNGDGVLNFHEFRAMMASSS